MADEAEAALETAQNIIGNAYDAITDEETLGRARELLANAAEAGQDGAQAAIAQANELIQAAAPHVKQAVAASAEALGTTWKLACAGAGVAVAELGTAAALAAQVAAPAAGVAVSAAAVGAGVAGDAASAAGEAMAPAGAAVADAAGTAAGVATSAAVVGAGVAGDTLSAAGEAVAPAVGAVATGAADAGGVVLDVGREVAVEGAGVVYDGATAFFNSDVFQNIEAPAWGEISAAYNSSADAIAATLAAAAGAVKGLFDFALFDIFRDFFQFIGLFFAGFTWPSSFQKIWGSITSVFSFNFDEITVWFGSVLAGIRNNVTIILFILTILTCLILFGVVAYFRSALSPDALKEGLEVTTWGQVSKKKRLATKITLTGLVSLYLPMTQQTLKMLVCQKPQWESVFGECYSIFHLILGAMGVVMILLVTIYLPYLCYTLILANRPHEINFDETGEAKEFSDEDYRIELQKDKCPYKFLYDGYERKWAFYKCLVMVIKLLCALPIIILSNNILINRFNPEEPCSSSQAGALADNEKTFGAIQTASVILILLTYTILSFVSQPFIKDANDYMDICARVTTACTAILGFFSTVILFEKPDCDALGSDATASDYQEQYAESNGLIIIGWILNILQLLNAIIMLTMLIVTRDSVNRKFRSWVKRIKLSKVPGSNVPKAFSPRLDLHRERKVRIWYPFWDSLFLNHEMYKPPELEKNEEFYFAEAPKTPPYLQNFRGTVGERHIENQRIVTKVGKVAYGEALQPKPQEVMQAMAYIRHELVGVDTYWDGVPEDGILDSLTNFGKCYVYPFPFTVGMYYDDGEDYVFVKSQEDIVEFANKNLAPEVQRRKAVRRNLRAMVGMTVAFHHQETHQKTKTRTVRDSDGNTRTERYQVSVLFTFENGIFDVGHEGKTTFQCADGAVIKTSHGFIPTLHFSDGQGTDNEGKHWTNEPCTLGAAALGITNDYQDTPNLAKLFTGCKWEENVLIVNGHYQEYTDHFVREQDNKVATLSYGFWYNVYNNDTLQRADLDQYLHQGEVNPNIQNLVQLHDNGINYLYARINFFNSHPATGYWFYFWSDVWDNNKELGKFEDNAALLDPANPDAICYHPKAREELEAQLVEAGLRSSGGGGFLKNRWLDQFYDTLDKFCTGERTFDAPDHDEGGMFPMGA